MQTNVPGTHAPEPGTPGTNAGGTTANPNGGELWNDAAKMAAYDMVMLSCECSETNENKGGVPGKPGARGFDTFVRAFEAGILIRVTGDIIALSPPLIIERKHVDELFGKLAEVLKAGA